MTERAGERCQRRDCAGGYEDVGGGERYCDLCGLAPVVSPGGLLSATPTGLRLDVRREPDRQARQRTVLGEVVADDR
ncbi:hypothetical protein, partial [Streptomyces tubercidicus]